MSPTDGMSVAAGLAPSVPAVRRLEGMRSRLSMIFIGLFGLLPYVTTVKFPPYPNFWGEWIAAVLAVAWLMAVGTRAKVPAATPPVRIVPVSALAAAGFVAVLLLQLLVQQPMFRGAPLLALAIVSLAGLMCLAGARLRAAGGATQMLDAWSCGILIALGLNLVAALLHREGWYIYIYQLGPQKPPDRAVGLIGQPNQLAVFAVLAACAAHYLWLRARLSNAAQVLVALAVAVIVAATASRAGALLWVGAWGLCGLALRGQPRRLAGWRLLWCSLALFVAAQVLWNLLESAGGGGTTVLRATGRPRIELLRDSWELVQRHPLAGVGYGNFMAARWAELSGSLLEPASNQAHNLFAQLAVELGLIGATAVLLPMGYGLWRCAAVFNAREVAPEQFLAASIALVVAGYAMVEYPLWYTYFLLPFALALGLVAQRELQVPASTAPRWARGVGWTGAALLCLVVAVDYRRIERLYTVVYERLGEVHRGTVSIPQQPTSDVALLSFFDMYANVMYSRTLGLGGPHLPEKLAITNRAMLSLTGQETIARQVAFLVVAGDEVQARALIVKTGRDPTLRSDTRRVLELLAPLNPKLAAFVAALPALPAASAAP